MINEVSKLNVNWSETNLKHQVITLDGSDWFAQWSYTIQDEGDRIVVYEQHKGYSEGCFWTEPNEIDSYWSDTFGVVEVAQRLKRSVNS